MRILNVISFFLLGMSFSVWLLLPLIPVRQVSPRFYRLFGILAASFCATYALFDFAQLSILWGGTLTLLVSYCLAMTFKPESIGNRLYPLVLLSTLLLYFQKSAAVYTPLGVHSLEPWLFHLNFALSALFLGSTLIGMLLGHWYLVEPKLSIEPFKRLIKASIAIMITRIAMIGFGLLFYAQQLPPGKKYLFEELISIEGELIFLIQRVLFGILLPALLAYFIWNTVKIRSTQSATGILYVNLVFVLIGELLGIHLTLSTGFLM